MKHPWTKISYCILLCVAMATATLHAQDVLPQNALPMIVTPHTQVLTSDARVFHAGVTANVDYTVSTEADWLHIKKSVNGVYVHASENLLNKDRTADIVFANEANGVTSKLRVTQKKLEPGEGNYGDIAIRPSSANLSGNTAHSGEGIEKSIDGDYSTLFHTAWYNGPVTRVSETNPAVLTYNFTNVELIEYICYVPRQDAGTNGCFELLDLYVKCAGDSDYRLFGTYNWPGDNSIRTISLGEGGLQNPVSIQFRVKKGSGDYASCAEMEFYKKGSPEDNPFSIFTDDMYTTLRPGFTEADLDNVEDPIAKSLAWQILNDNYSTKYRVASYQCYNSPQYFSDIWNAPGKWYDQVAGVTGINMEKGKHAVLVSGIPDSMSVQLKVVAWYVGKDGSSFDGGNPNTSTFVLRNGMNIINYTYDWPGLAYVCYYSYGYADKNPDIKVHFINGDAQGYLSPDKTNAEMHELTANATNTCMDLLGSRVHSIWTSEGLHNYCKASDGTSIGYRQFMNVLDSLVMWEQDLLGFKKYDRMPDLRTMAYTNYTYYMFQGSFGVSFHHNEEPRVLNCKTIMYNDYDAIWGLSHEWGHQHQMTPYFNFAGMTEVTNNMNSYYNVVHMGYTSNFGHGAEPSDGLALYNETNVSRNDQTTYTNVTNLRSEAYKRRSEFSWNSKLYALCDAMKDSVFTSVADDKLHAFSYDNYYNLRPYIALYQYAVSVLGIKDFAQDMYEALRQTDYVDGSSIEKSSGLDKYEALAAAQNGNKGGHYAHFRSKWPESVWATEGYLQQSTSWNRNSAPFIFNLIRKTSRLTGYNLFPYFEKCGFLRNVALRFYDGNWFLLTQDMYDEFKADMEALETSEGLKQCDDAMIKAILTQPVPSTTRPSIPN